VGDEKVSADSLDSKAFFLKNWLIETEIVTTKYWTFFLIIWGLFGLWGESGSKKLIGGR
jgi:hypothetical protein